MKYTREQYLEMTPQRGVKQCFIDAPGFNAAWDYKISPDGRHYIPLCAEGNFPEYVKLYEYLPAANEMRLCFDLEKSIVVYPRTIRPSKIHTSINFMPDGKLIMTTHTTASAPGHPIWMPEAYYEHLWEGFHGSNVLIWDPDTGKVEDLGIPVPRDTIYGAVYEPSTRSLYFTTYFRGHAYRFDLDDRSVTDFGQCTEFGTYYMFRGPDGSIYFSTRSGAFWRINVEKRCPEYLGIEFPIEGDYSRRHNVFAYADNGPDGRLYFCTHHGRRFLAYDPRTNTLETLGYTVPAGMREDYPDGMVFGMAFDREGKLWYGLSTHGCHLCRIDVRDPDAEAEDFGLAGTPGRAHHCFENGFIRGDTLYFSDSNHANDPPGILTIDLAAQRADRDLPRVRCQDPTLFLKDGEIIDADLFDGDPAAAAAPYIKDRCLHAQERQAAADNPHAFGGGKRWVAKLWLKTGIEGSAVRAAAYDAAGNALAWTEGGKRITTHDGDILDIADDADAPQPDFPALPEGITLPAHRGRQYLAVASAACTLSDGSILVGTKDGMLARVKDGHVFSYGAVCNDGPVRALAVCPGGRRAYGAAGDPESLGEIFSFDLDDGVELGGHVYFENGDSKAGTGVSSEPCCLAVSPDGKRLAIGVRDRLGCLYEYEI